MEIRQGETAIEIKTQETMEALVKRREAVARLTHWSAAETWVRLVRTIPSINEERWRVVPREGRWVVRYEPLNHLELWRDLAEFQTEQEAIVYGSQL